MRSQVRVNQGNHRPISKRARKASPTRPKRSTKTSEYSEVLYAVYILMIRSADLSKINNYFLLLKIRANQLIQLQCLT
jgi:hypothetical protein